jgi:ankyrin repeat protein
MILFYAGLAGTAISLLLLVFGPQSGMETLGVGLFAYFNLLYHLVAGPLVLFWLWRRKRPLPLRFVVGMYFAIIYGIGLYQYIIVSDLDDAAREKMAQVSEPQGYRLRELGFQLWVAASSDKPIDQAAMAEVMSLIPQAQSLNARTDRYRPVLWYLAGIGADDAIRMLIAQGAVLDDPELFDTSPLYHATTNGHTTTVRLLLEAGADPNAVDHRGVSAATVAVTDENLPLLQLLINANADLNLAQSEPAPFARALRKGRSDIVALLLANGAEPVLYGYQLAIESAIAQRDTAMVAVLVAEGGGFEAQTEQREPVLFQFVNSCDFESFAWALQLGADPDVRTLKNDNLLSRVIALNTRVCPLDEVRLQFAEALLAADVDVEQKSARDDTPLLAALYHKRAGIVRALIQAGAKFDGVHSSKQGNVLILAARAGLNDVVDEALARGLDINHRWQSKLIHTNALLAAVGAGHEETVAHLFANGAILTTDFTGDILVHNCFLQAARHPAVLEHLVRHYLTGKRERREEKLMRYWVGSTADPAPALAVLDRLGISK